MDRLWAPWRMAYVTQAKDASGEGQSCFICRAVQASDDRAHHLLRRTSRSVVMLNKFPYNNGHLLVCPASHLGSLSELSDEDLLDLQRELQLMTELLSRLMSPDGFNIGLNLGRVAGAGLPGHLHWHIVPRWHGDTNFMPVISDTRVIVQSLESLYDLLQGLLRDRQPCPSPPAE